MTEYRYERLPQKKVDPVHMAPAITEDLNRIAAEGWEVVSAVESGVLSRVDVIFKRD